MSKIVIDQIYKIFGPNPKSMVGQLKNGITKEEALEKKGHVIGVNDVSLNIEDGETFVIMGLSGSGKSTLIRHINRLIEPTSGRILVDGEDIVAYNPEQLRHLRRKKISMVFQRFGLLPHKTVRENVAAGLLISGVPKPEAMERASKQINVVGLAGFEENFPSQLSGGMQQRVGLARALSTDAEILLMDEAFSALDPLIRNDMQQQLLELQKEYHKTIVFITHDLDEALRIGNHIAILKDGELRQVGTGEQILTKPADDYVRRFVMDVNRTRVVTMNTILQEALTINLNDFSRESTKALLEQSPEQTVFVVDHNNKPLGAITTNLLEHELAVAGDKILVDQLEPIEIVPCSSVIDDVLPQILKTNLPLCVVNKEGKVVGASSAKNILRAVARPVDDV